MYELYCGFTLFEGVDAGVRGWIVAGGDRLFATKVDAIAYIDGLDD